MEIALGMFEDIRDVLIEEYSSEHFRVGSALHNIGVIYVRMGKIRDACNIFREAIKIRKEMLGEYHPKVGDSLLELGIALLSRKDNDEALAVFAEALQIRRRDSDKEFSLRDEEVRKIQLSKILNNIGCVYFECQSNRKALKSFEEALEIQMSISEKKSEAELDTPVDLPMASTLSNISYVHMANERWSDAIEYLEIADELQQSILDPSNPIVTNTLENLAYCSAMEGYRGMALAVST